MVLRQYEDPFSRELCTKLEQAANKKKQKQRDRPPITSLFNYCCYIDISNYCFTPSKLVGLGAIDLTKLKIGENSLLTWEDIKNLNNWDFFPHQKHYKLLVAQFKEMASRDLHKLWKEVLPNFKQDINLVKSSNKQEAIKTLAMMTNVRRVKYLA